MMQIDAVEEFQVACQEIHLLLNYSKKNSKNVNKYATFNKAAIVLLCAKFEAFLENFLEEYAYYHLNTSSNHSVEPAIYEHIIDGIVNHLEFHKNKPDKRREIISKLELLCGSAEVRPINQFHIDAKLRLGKHGQREVERLLKAFGFSEYTIQEIVKSFFTKFNSLYSIRNNIVHEDKTPSLTHQTVQSYLDSVKEFIDGLRDSAVVKMELAN